MKATIDTIDEGIWSLDVSGELYVEDVPRMQRALALLPPTSRCLILVGGATIFNSGATRVGLLRADGSVADCGATMARLLLDVGVPTVAAMAGHALGGGLVMGLWCDIAVLAEESLYGANFMSIGFTPGMGATAALEESVGSCLAREMLYTGRIMTGRELRERGATIPHILPRRDVKECAVELAREITLTPIESGALLRRTLTNRRRLRMESALREEQEMHQIVFASSEIRERIAERLPDG